jgi:hypothetical protein
MYMEGNYPQKKKQIVYRNTFSPIEFLTEGNLCTIWGTHYKTGEPYQCVHIAPPITFKFEDLKLPVGGEWKAKAATNGVGLKHSRPHAHGTISRNGGINWAAYDAAIDAQEDDLVELLATEYFDVVRVDGVWRCGDITGRRATNRGSFIIEPNGRCTDWDDESHPTLMDAITSDLRDERNTYDDVFTFLAQQGEEFNFFMPVAPEELPQVLLPFPGRNESVFAEHLAKHLPENTLFNKDGLKVELQNDEELGAEDNVVIAPFGLTTSKFSVMKSMRLATWVEQYMDTGVLVEVEKDNWQFKAKTMADLTARRMLEGVTFAKKLSRINRILDVAVPIRTINGDIIYPELGYNKSLQLYCDSHAPVVEELDHQRALDIILKDVYGEFCFKDEQSKTHAVARLITPYVRGIMGFHVRTPLWWFDGNRPGTGKDYCNGVTQLVYQGRAFEDAPVGENSEETRKRITAALVAGRRMMYFANCQHHLSDPTLLTAITDSVFRTRMLGATNAESDLEIINEMEFALSANMGITCKEDFERRIRKITLEFFEQDPNSRRFNRPDLWQWVVENRALVLSAIHTLVLHWLETGQPQGKTPFTSFPVWAHTVGGILTANGLGDPCLPQMDDDHFGGDLRTRAMTALYETIFERGPDVWWTKEQIYRSITDAQHGRIGLDGDDRLEWFGDLNNEVKKQDNRTKVGLSIKAFKGRILNDIKMEVDTSQRSARQKIRCFHV